MNTFDYWFELMVRNGAYSQGENGTCIWTVRRDKYVIGACSVVDGTKFIAVGTATENDTIIPDTCRVFSPDQFSLSNEIMKELARPGL